LSGQIRKKNEENGSYGRKHSLGRDYDKLNEYWKTEIAKEKYRKYEEKQMFSCYKKYLQRNVQVSKKTE
jgi:hypothetical protein